MAFKNIRKTDFWTVSLHWALVLTLLFSLSTGFRIRADDPDAGLVRVFSGLLLQGNVVQWHVWSALALSGIIIAYVAFLARAKLIRRVSMDAGTRRDLTAGPARRRLRAVNILIYWAAFAVLAAAVATGIALYAFPGLLPSPLAMTIHRYLAWSVLGYVALHVAAQLAYGGLSQILKIFNPRIAFGTAAITSLTVASAVAIGLYAVDRLTVAELVVREIALPPVIDGSAGDPSWAGADMVEIATARGVNTPEGEKVQARLIHDSEFIYALFEWNDDTRSRKHLPLIKSTEGWRVLQSEYGIQDEDDFYEDKFGVMFADKPELAGAGTAHLGPQPIADKPQPSGGRGLHYTDDGSIVDVWHWKSVRTGAFNQMDDNYFGPPMAESPKASRYTGGYTQDPKTSGGYTMNWETFSDHIIVPKRLPKDPRTLDAYQTASLSPNDTDSAAFAMDMADTVPYSAEADTLPVGTVMPSVLIDGPHLGDRGEVYAKAQWSDGRWTLEARRRLETGSEYDFSLSADRPIYMWVAVFDHTQTRHSQHLHPVKLVRGETGDTPPVVRLGRSPRRVSG